MILILSGVAIAVLIVFQTYTAMANEKTDSQPYQIIRTEKDFEIRLYPKSTLATITSNAKTYKELGSSGFGKLAGYIFGGNADKKQISMTSPVYMDINDSASTMSFVMPANFNLENLPKPNNPDVKIHIKSEEYVAAIRFGGYASDKAIKEHTEKLEKALKANSIVYFGNFRFLGYNPPYQFFGRRNEVVVNVNPN